MNSMFQEIQPSPRLALAIECFWFFEANYAQQQLILPDGCTDLLLRFDKRLYAFDLVGIMTHSQQVSVSAGHSYLGLRIRPGMTVTLLQTHGALLVDKTISFAQAWQKDVAPLTRRLIAAENIQERVCLLEALFDAQMSITPLQVAIDLLAVRHGMVSLEELCDIAHLGERQLRRQFIARTGLSPKTLARILRFRHLSQALQRDPNQNLAAAAIDCGYYDQAHMTHEFQYFTGITPTGYIASIDVRFLQDLRA